MIFSASRFVENTQLVEVLWLNLRDISQRRTILEAVDYHKFHDNPYSESVIGI